MATINKRISYLLALSFVAGIWGCTYNEDDLRPGKKQPAEDAGLVDAATVTPDLPVVVFDAGAADVERIDIQEPKGVDAGVDLTQSDSRVPDAADSAIETVVPAQFDAAEDEAVLVDGPPDARDTARRIDATIDGTTLDGQSAAVDAHDG